MEKSNIIKYDGVLELGNISIDCYVLSDGTRVLSGNGMQNALKMVDENDVTPSGSRLARYLGQKTLEPYILQAKEQGHFEPIVCYKGEQKINGYDAVALIDICDAFLQARKEISLSARQSIIAEQCEILMRSFAKVGLIALIDEATNYQYERESDELQKILKAYIAQELMPWQKRFPDVFYTELFRLNGWDFTVKGIKKRPGVIGTWTNKLVYEQLPEGVLKELKNNTPKSESGNYTARFFQGLTSDVGDPHLTAQINQIVTLFRLSDNMEHMWRQFEKLKLRQSGQLELPFNFDEQGHTIEPTQPENLSQFNKSLLKATNFNPNKKK